MVGINEDSLKHAVNRALLGPSICVDDKEIPVYERSKSAPKADYSDRPEYIKTLAKYGQCSPNMVKAIQIGTDAIIKTYFDGKEERFTFGRDGQRVIENLAYDIANKHRKSIKGVFDAIIRFKTHNIEEIYIDKAFLIIAGMKVSIIDSVDMEDLLKSLKAPNFKCRFFGGDEKNIYDEFKRLGVIALGERRITLNDFIGYWEVKKCDDGKSRYVNNHWVVQDSLYAKDNWLYKYVTDYNNRYFN